MTEAQRRAVAERDGPLLVAAAAGSGKTSVMVERFVAAVLEDGVAVGDLLAITFTEKAAGELRERIRRTFLERGERAHARETEGASISTIHGLCARLLRSHALRAGLDPRFAVLDDADAERLARRAFDEALEDVCASGGDELLGALAPFDVDSLRDLVTAAFAQLRTRGQSVPRVPPAPSPTGDDPDDGDARRTYAALDSLLTAYGRRYGALKSARSAVDFEDLELGARDLLRGNPGLRERESARYAHVMVDEFQDTNPVQLEIVDLLARDNVFEVGDEFQSIYRFRHADVALFRARRESRAAAGRLRSLAENFRGAPELLAVINSVAGGPLFGEDFPGLRAGREEAPAGTEPPVELLVTVKGGWEGEPAEAPAWRLAEARLLAARIAELPREGWRWRDVVVLLRATTDMAIYERALDARGVPTYLVGGRGFWGRREVADLIAYLALLANPRDDLALYGSLASPLARTGSDALALIAAAARGRCAADALADPGVVERLEPGDRARVEAFAGRMDRHRALAARLPLDELVERVVEETGYAVALLAMPGGERRLANVRKLLRLARRFEAAEGPDLRGLVDHVSALAGEGIEEDREAEAPVEGEALDAVRIMSIHRAKGLEFPVVCVADLGRVPPSRGREHLRLGADGSVGLRIPGIDGSEARTAFDWDRVGTAEQEADDLEERRLLYVAMTRAEERLVLSGALAESTWRKGTSSEPLARLARGLLPDLAERLAAGEWAGTERNDGWRLGWALNTPRSHEELLERTGPPAASAPDEAPAPPPEPEPAPPAVRRAPVDHISYSALESYGQCGYRFYLRRVLGLPEAPRPAGARVEPAGEYGLGALARGTLAHALLERMDLRRPIAPGPGAVGELAAAEGVELTEPDAAEIADLVSRFAGSELRARMATADALRKESPFAFTLDTEAGHPLLVTGVVDVLARWGDRALVVDYKTDSVDEDLAVHTERAYGTQRLVYALAALTGGAADVEVAHCYLESGRTVTATFSAADATALQARLGELAAGLLAEEFRPTDRPHRWLCQTCPGRSALCVHEPSLTMRESPDDPPLGEPAGAASAPADG